MIACSGIRRPLGAIISTPNNHAIFKFITDDGNGLQCALFTSFEALTDAARVYVLERDPDAVSDEATLGEIFAYYCEHGLGGDYMNWNSEEMEFGTELEERLGRCYDALQKCIGAIDLHDEFGDDTEAREELEEEACRAAKNALPEPEPRKCYAVTGRFAFDDEDATLVRWAESENDAVSMWEAWMKDEDPKNENDLIVNSVLSSYAAIN